MKDSWLVNSIADIDFLYVVALGIMLGAAELMGRYRDDPGSVFRAPPAWIYLGVNGALAALSLYLIHKLGINIKPVEGTSSPDDAARIYNIIAAGFGGAAFFRSSVMKTKVGDTDVAIGPAIVIDTLLRVTDREVDRYRAEERAERIAQLMQGLDLNQATNVVVPYCTGLMQNMTAAEQQTLRKEARAFATEKIASATKPKVVALRLVNIVGFRVLETAVNELRKSGDLPKQTDEKEPTRTVFGRIFGGGSETDAGSAAEEPDTTQEPRDDATPPKAGGFKLSDALVTGGTIKKPEAEDPLAYEQPRESRSGLSS